MKEIRVAVIGFGFMGRAHTFGYKTIPLYYNPLPFKIRLAAVCAPREEVVRQAKELLDFETAVTDPEEIFSNPAIDAVSICTPNVFHKDLVLRAIAAGKHVYCDKPLAATAAESGEILAALEHADVITQMALQNRFIPATMRAKELIDDGRLGRIIGFRAGYFHSGSIDPAKPMGWKQEKKSGGGGVLFDLGSHILDLMYHLLGEYAALQAHTQILYPRRPDRHGNMVEVDADDSAILCVEMKNGAHGVIEASKIATGLNDELRFEIHGDRGALRFNTREPNHLEFFDNTVPEAPLGGGRGFTAIECIQRYPAPGGSFPGGKFALGWIRSHVDSLYHFLECVHEHRPASPSFREGAYIQRVMEAAYESDRAGRRITL